MKRITINTLLIIFLFYSGVNLAQIKKQERIIGADEFMRLEDFEDIKLTTPPCDCNLPDIEFGYSINASLTAHNLIKKAYEKKLNQWFDRQYGVLENEIENQLGMTFPNFHEAQKVYFRNLEKGNVGKNIHPVGSKYSSRIKTRRAIKRKNVSDHGLLELRKLELKAGITNSKYGHLLHHSTPLAQLNNISQIEALQKSEVDAIINNEIPLNRESNIYSYLGQIRHELENVKNLYHPILTESLQKQLEHYNSYNRWEQLDLMQLYLNNVRNLPPLLLTPIHATDAATPEFIEYFANQKSGGNNSIFSQSCTVRLPSGRDVTRVIPECVAAKKRALEEILNSISNKDMIAEVAIVGLGQRNLAFLNTRPTLKQKVSEYFKANDFSKNSHDAINYLLNQYQDKKDFEANADLYVSAPGVLFQDGSNKNRALTIKPNNQAIQEGITNFGNVLAELLKDNTKPGFKGFIIRNMFLKNGIPVSSLIDDDFIGRYFDFIPSTGNHINIHYNNNLGIDLFQLGIFTNPFLQNSNNILPLSLLEQKQPDYFGQSVLTPSGPSRIHENAVAITNANGHTIAFITPDEKFFYWVHTPTAEGWFLEGAPHTYKKNYWYYVEDKYNRQSQPISWGIHRASDELGASVVNLIGHPDKAIRDFANSMIKIISLDFNIEKTWESILNADLSDASYLAASIALSYLSGPKGKGLISASETPQFQEILSLYAPKTTRPAKLTWPEILQLFAKAKVFEKNISQHLKTVYKASDGYSVFHQVYLKIDGVVSIADDLIFNEKTGKIILNESKYGIHNRLTKNQKFIQEAIKNGKHIVIKSNRDFISSSGRVIWRKDSYIFVSEILRSHSVNGVITSDTIKTLWTR